MKVLVCGRSNIGETNPFAHHRFYKSEISRASSQRKFVHAYLSRLHLLKPITELISGNEGGAEEIGLHWATINSVPTVVWNTLIYEQSMLIQSLKLLIGKRQSSRSNKESINDRNKRMMTGSKPDVVLIFSGGETTSEISEGARDRGLEIVEVEVPNFDASPRLSLL